MITIFIMIIILKNTKQHRDSKTQAMGMELTLPVVNTLGIVT